MTGSKKPKNHHWWPVAMQSYRTDNAGNVSWVKPSRETFKKRAANRRIGFKIHGHTIYRGTCWESNFETEFGIDNEIHNIITALKELRSFGRTPSEFLGLMGLLFKKDRTLRDICRYYHLDEQIHRSLLLLVFSLLIRSPSNRSKYESYPKMAGLPPNEEVGKANMQQNYRIAKKLCEDASISNQYFVLLHTPLKRFIFGDGSLDWLTDGLVSNRINGRTLIPLTPHMCVYFCTPLAMRPSPNCASLIVAPWMVDQVNEITQIYSNDKLFFVGKTPDLTDAFRQGKFLEHKEKTDALLDMLDEIAGIKKQSGFGFSSALSEQ